MSKSDYLEDAMLDHILGGATIGQPATVYLALFTSDPTDADTGTEVSGGAYARQPATFAAASGGSKTTSADISFPIATASWGTVSNFGIYDALTAGNLLYHGALTSSVTVGIDNQVIVPTGELTATED